jgi:hypothetical protein
MNIAILMWYDDNIKYYADNFYEINKKYTKKHGYTLIKSSERTYTDRKPHWERFPLMLKHIESYDYVMWIDADAHFYVDAPPIENLINKYNKDIILSEDIPDSKDFAPCINSGVIIMKNTPKNIDILKKWGYSEELKRRSDSLFNGLVWQDQGLIRMYVKYNLDNINDISVIVPYLELQHFHVKEISNKTSKPPYIHHYAGSTTKARLKGSKNYLNDTSSFSGGIIAGIVIGSIFLFIILYYLLYRK